MSSTNPAIFGNIIKKNGSFKRADITMSICALALLSTITSIALVFLGRVTSLMDSNNFPIFQTIKANSHNLTIILSFFLLGIVSSFFGAVSAPIYNYFLLKARKSKYSFWFVLIQILAIFTFSTCRLMYQNQLDNVQGKLYVGSLLTSCAVIFHMIFTPPQSCGERRNGRPTENNWKLVLQNISSMGVTVYSIVRAVIEIGNLRIWTEMDISLNDAAFLALFLTMSFAPLVCANYTVVSKSRTGFQSRFGGDSLCWLVKVALAFAPVFAIAMVFIGYVHESYCVARGSSCNGRKLDLSDATLILLVTGPFISILSLYLKSNSISDYRSDLFCFDESDDYGKDPDDGEDPVDPDGKDPDDGGEPVDPDADDRGKFGGGLIILFWNIVSSLAMFVGIVIVALDVLYTILCNWGWCGKLSGGILGDMSLEPIFVLSCGLFLANFAATRHIDESGLDTKIPTINYNCVQSFIVYSVFETGRNVWALVVAPTFTMSTETTMASCISVIISCGALLAKSEDRLSAHLENQQLTRMMITAANCLMVVPVGLIYEAQKLINGTELQILGTFALFLSLGCVMLICHAFFSSGKNITIMNPIFISSMVSFYVPVLFSVLLSCVTLEMDHGIGNMIRWGEENLSISLSSTMALYFLSKVFYMIGWMFTVVCQLFFSAGSVRREQMVEVDIELASDKSNLPVLSKHNLSESDMRFMIKNLWATIGCSADLIIYTIIGTSVGVVLQEHITDTLTWLADNPYTAEAFLVALFCITTVLCVSSKFLCIGCGYLCAIKFGAIMGPLMMLSGISIGTWAGATAAHCFGRIYVDSSERFLSPDMLHRLHTTEENSNRLITPFVFLLDGAISPGELSYATGAASLPYSSSLRSVLSIMPREIIYAFFGSYLAGNQALGEVSVQIWMLITVIMVSVSLQMSTCKKTSTTYDDTSDNIASPLLD